MPDVQPPPGRGSPEGTTGSPPPADDAPDGPLVEDAARRAEGLLAEHVPLTLLVDLVAPVVTSAELADEEGLPVAPWWGQGPAGPSPSGRTDDGEDPGAPVRP